MKLSAIRIPVRLRGAAEAVVASFLLFACLALSPGTPRAEDAPGSARRDTICSDGFFGRVTASRLWFERVWGGGGSGGSTPVNDLDTECRMLSPFYGCAIDTIIVTGNTRTKEVAILREMSTKQGARLEERLIRRDSAYLRGLGYFAEVSITAERIESGAIRVLVALIERPGLFMWAPYPVVNYDFEKGISYGFTWKVKNFRGMAENLAVSALMRRDKERGASFSWNIPWLFGRRMNLNLGGHAYERLEEPAGLDDEYVKERNGGSVSLGIPLTRSLVNQLWFRTALSFDARVARLMQPDPDNGHVSEFYRQNFLSTYIELLFDSRANKLSPFDGMLHRAWARRYSSVSGLDQEYIYYGFSNAVYVPVGPERSFIFAIDTDVREGDLTSLEDMKLGGMRDVRGWVDNELRGTAKIVGTVQYRMKLFGPRYFRLPKIGAFDFTVNGVAFVDSGTLTDSVLDFRASAFHSSGGIGLEVISPLRDLIRFEVAADAHGQYAYYMTAGTDF